MAETITFRGSKEYKKQLHQVALDRDMKVQQLLEQAVAQFVGQEIPERKSEKVPIRLVGPNETVIQITFEETVWVEKLLRVLRSQKKRFIRAVTSNLDIFADHCQRAKDIDDTSVDSIAGPKITIKTGDGSPSAARRAHSGATGNLRGRRGSRNQEAIDGGRGIPADQVG